MAKHDPNEIASDLIRHQVRVIRNETRVDDEIQAEILGQLEKTVISTLVAARPDEPARRGDQLNRAEAAIAEVGKKSRASMKQAASKVATEAVKIIAADQIAVARIMTRRGVPVLPAPEKVIRKIVENATFNGAAMDEWWGRQAEDVRRFFADQLRAGLREGEALGDLVKRMEGESAARGGILNLNRRRQAETLVRTSVNSQLGAVRTEMFKRNSGVIRAQQFLTAFDQKVCVQCASFSGGIFDFEGNPLPESPVQVPFPGGGSGELLHPNDRCTFIAVLVDEPAADDISFEDWLQKQDAKVQVEVLGRSRRDLWQNGQIKLSQLVDQRGRPMTVEALRDAA